MSDVPRDACPVPDCRSGWVSFNGGQIPCQSCGTLAEIERRAREADFVSGTWSWTASPPEVLALVKDRDDWIARHGTIDELRLKAEADAATPPTTADLPTTPGSVIEAETGEGRFLWMCVSGQDWLSASGDLADADELTDVRVLFDAGERGEP